MTEADHVPVAGEVLGGKYRIEGVLGQGGMGIVLGAMHLHLDQRVAIKFLLPELTGDPTLVQRFLREGRAAIKIRSEHVVRILDVSTLPGGTPYMVMEYLDGSNLEDLVQRGGPLPVNAAVDYVLQAIEALAEAHALGMVHRDLKPANLFLVRRADDSPCVKVLDFGITKLTAGGTVKGSTLGMTGTQAILGSPRYMSPEQMRSTRTVDARADVWALGVILYELLAGVPPFQATTMPELVASIVSDPPPPLRQRRPDAPAALADAIARCLEKEPAGRFPDVASLASAIAPFAPGSQASAERAARVLRASMPSAPGATSRVPEPSTVTASTFGATSGRGRAPWVLGSAVAAIVVLLVAGLALRHAASGAREAALASPTESAPATAAPSPWPVASSSAPSPATTASAIDAPVASSPPATPIAAVPDGSSLDASAASPPHARSTSAPHAPRPAHGATSSKDDDLFDGRH